MVKCPRCGTENPSYVVFCGRCGSEIPKKLRDQAAMEAEKSSIASSHDKSRPLEVGQEMAKAPIVAWSASAGPGGPESEQRTTRLTARPSIGGACAIVAGVLALIQGILFILGSSFFISISGRGFGILLGIGEIVLGLMSINAGQNARACRRFDWALIGSILGMVAAGFGIGLFLGLVAVILIAISYEEFKP